MFEEEEEKLPHYFEFKTPPNLKRTPHLKGGFLKGEEFASQYILLSVKFVTLLVRPLVIRGNWRVRGFRGMKHTTWNLRSTLIFGPEKCQKVCVLNSNMVHNFDRGPGSSVGIATELRVGRFGDRIPVGAQFSARSDRPWGPPSLLYNGYRVFPGGKERPGHDADHSPPSSAAVMEDQSYTSTHPLGHNRACK